MKRVILFFSFLCMIACIASAKTKTSYRNALILAYSQANSVYEDDNLKLEIYDEQLWATNKTQKTIFIDLSQCFLVNNGSSYPMYDKEQNEKHASKKGNSTSIDEFISIAPTTGSQQNATFICRMAMRIYGKYSTSESPSGNFSDYEKRLLTVLDELLTESKKADRRNVNYVGTATRHFTEDESISNIGASIAYAFNKRSEDWTSVSLSTWVSDVIFAPYYVEMPDDLTKKEKRGFGVKETDPAEVHVKADTPFEFDEDKSPIIVCDWEGNYKKGTFELSTTSIEKKRKVGFLATIFTLGYANLFSALDATYYKKIIKFDGPDSDWGKMTYVDDIMKTEQD